MSERDGGSEAGVGGGGGDRAAAAAAATAASSPDRERPTLKVHLPNGFHMVKYSESTDVKVSGAASRRPGRGQRMVEK